ncbi:TOPRIM nucleotidyl transferase/hydrolase domain-containing protein [Nocardioides sp. Iso805N]|uniref:TOPRIM nucleotidyl transferase/hydrolase domain-containing protein n=1 Tax=Nocardioides sp. Iso805N TaxID=1283287 RepID=UPI000375B2E3|nr:TOPRIM nucleotidyl transferase/hydrolase domain-containing protein [Nocardioides sp. Iso805N]
MARPITILVEGDSDKAAVETLAPRYGIDLGDETIEVVSMGGAGNAGRFIAEKAGAGRRVGGLYDEAEERFFARALNRQEGEDLSRQGFFACRRDLEEELVRALGVAAVTELLEGKGDLSGFRAFQNQDAHRADEAAEQLRRFIGANGGRKRTYAAAMADVVPLEAIPEPLEGLLSWIWSA